jgi:hypothetical protein
VPSLLGLAAVAVVVAGERAEPPPKASSVERARPMATSAGPPRPWLRSGIACTVAGGALGIASIVVGASDPCSAAGTGTCRRHTRNRTAIALGVPAALALAGGIAMTVVGARQRRISGTATASRDGAALWLHGWF